MHSFFVEIVAALEGFISTRGYGLFVCNLAEDPARERPQLEMLVARQVDGVVLASSTVRENADLLRALAAKRKGLVLVDRDDHPGIACHRVLTDDLLVGRLATAHLIELGHREIAHISAHLAHARRREEGYRAELARQGITVRPEWVIPGGFLEQEGYDAMKRLLAARGGVTAVFAVNDPAAVGALKAAWEAGLRVPEDISIIGAGDIAHGDLLRVPLSTISWSRKEIGVRAAQLILDQLEAHPTGPFSRVVVEPRVIARASTAPPAEPAGRAAPRPRKRVSGRRAGSRS
jgi:DNA-binding LacI/PurR family transcriptional regulator